MTTALLALLLALPVDAAQPPAASPPPAPSQPAPAKVGTIVPEAQSVFDRAVAAYQGAKGYIEVAQTTMTQQASNLMKDQEPPADQASTTTFVWGGPEAYAFSTRDISVYQTGTEAVVYVKALGQFTRREPTTADRAVFANMRDLHPVYTAMISGSAGKPFPRVLSITKVEPQTLRGKAGKRLTGTGLPPLPGFEVACPVGLWFDDATGLLGQWSFDLKGVIQKQIDDNRKMMGATTPRPVIEKFSVTVDWVEAAVTDTPPPLERLTFKPAENDAQVSEFNLADGEGSVQHALIGTPAPLFEGKTIDGRPVSLKDLRGKVVLLHVWTCNNAASVTSLPAYQSLHSHYGQNAKSNVVVLGVCQDHPIMLEQTRATLARKVTNFLQLVDPDKAVSNAYRVSVVPSTILIDKEGVIRSITNDFDAADQVLLSAKIDRLIEGKGFDGLAEPKAPGFSVPVTPVTPVVTPEPAAPAPPAAPAAPAPAPKP